MKLLIPEQAPPLERPTFMLPRPPRKGAVVLLQVMILLMVAIVATGWMWAPALLSGHSAWFDLTRMVEFHGAIRSGDYFPTWSPDFYHGYGSPLFQFYSPLAYYFTEISVLAGFDFPDALKITFVVTLFASGLAMYRLISTYLSGWAACLGGVLYMVAPYRLVDIFVRHALAEHCAFLWLPLIVWGTERFITKKSSAALFTGFAATAGLILTHNIMALIGLPVCVAAGWALSVPKRGATSLLTAGLPALLGVGLAAFFWWPAMSGRPLTHATQSLTGGYFDFHRHFVDPVRLVALDWGFGESGAGATEKMSLQVGVPHLLAALGALALIVGLWPDNGDRVRERTRWRFVSLGIVLLALFLCSPWSLVLWENLPLIRYVQFPWRYLGLVVLGAAMCGALVVDRFAAHSERAGVIAFLVGLAAVMAAYFPYYSEARFLVADAKDHTVLRATAGTVEALAATQRLQPLGSGLSPGDLRAAGERATSSDDFLPRDVVEKPAHPAPEFLTGASQPNPKWTSPGFNRYRFDLHMNTAGPVELHQFWFPGWSATIDGKDTETNPIGPQAVVSCQVPAGDHAVEFHYGSLPARRVGLAISLLSAVLAAGVLLRSLLAPRAPKESLA